VTRGFRSAKVRPRRRGLRFQFRRLVNAPVRAELFRQSRGRRVLRSRRVAFFSNRRRSFTWRARRLRNGAYVARLSIPIRGGRDVRRFALLRRNGRFVLRRGFHRRPSCGLLRRFRLSSTVFGGRTNRRLVASYVLGRNARVSVRLLRGRRVVLRNRAGRRVAGPIHRVLLRSRGLRRGEYRIRLTAVAGNTRVTSTLGARKL
jgi:hypothetical protein